MDELKLILQSLFSRDSETVSAILGIIDEEERRYITSRLEASSHSVEQDGKADDIKLKVHTLITLATLLSDSERLRESIANDTESRPILTNVYMSLYELAKAGADHTVETAERRHYVFIASIAGMLADKHSEVSPYVRDLMESLDVENPDSGDTDRLYEHLEYLILQLIIIVKTNQQKELLIAKVSEFKAVYDIAQSDTLEATEEGAIRLHHLAAIGNLIYMLDKTLEFLFLGRTDDGENIYTLLGNYLFNAVTLYRRIQDSDKESSSILVKNMLEQFCRNSVWNIASRSPIFEKFFDQCINSTKNVLYTLLPSQRDTILDLLTLRKSTVINMPTSAGKSLLAELYILFTLYNNEDESNPPVVGYLVPTNALINQVKHHLTETFKDLGYRVDGVLPFSEIDPIEDEILRTNHTHVLISTPEKMDALIRANHKSVQNLKLVVLDEAHNIGSDERGAKMELLLAVIKRNKPDTRFLLMSPFVENAEKIAQWLGDTAQDSSAIMYEWTPTKQYVGTSQIKGAGKKLSVVYMPSGRDSLINEDLEIDIYSAARPLENDLGIRGVNRTEASLIRLAHKYSSLGTTLVVCNGAASAQKCAQNMFEFVTSHEALIPISDQHLSDVIELVALEIGQESSLIYLLKYGIAYHHAQLPPIIKDEIESLVREGLIKYIYATTTLAQGMNFPITTVIFKTLGLGGGASRRPIDNATFWNIAGRAGRAYMDTEGHILLLQFSSIPLRRMRNTTRQYIKKDLLEIQSSLKGFFESFNAGTPLNYALVKDKAAILSFLQYLNHLLHVSYNYDFEAIDLVKIRSMLSNSLVFNQIEFQAGFLGAQQQITDFVSAYVNQVSQKKTSQLTLADMFGISDISLSKFMAEMLSLKDELKETLGNQTEDYMKASKLILDTKDDVVLARVVDILSSIPELKVFMDGRGTLDSKSIAKIIIGWVGGENVSTIASSIKRDNETLEYTVGLCQRYINGNMRTYMPWGISIYQNLVSDQNDDAKNLPSYIYFGVKDSESVILSTAGVPRFAIHSIRDAYNEKYGTRSILPSQIDQIKENLRDLDYSNLSIDGLNSGALRRIVEKYV